MNSQITPTYHLEPGYLYISKDSGIIRTVIGSCVSVCIWDCVNTKGGMCSVERSKTPKGENPSGRDAGPAVTHLIKMLESEGGKRQDMKAQIFGGAGNSIVKSSFKNGTERAATVKKQLQKNGISIISEDTGGAVGRKIIFDTFNGHIVVAKVHNLREDDWF